MLFVLSQVFVVVNYTFIAASYAVKKRNLLLLFGFISLIANAISYILLSAWSGLAMVGVAILRNIVFLIQNKKENDTKIKPIDWVILVVLLSIIGVLAWRTYDGILSLFSVFATVLFSISVWQKNIIVYNIMGIVVSLCWIVYDAFVGSPVAIACEVILLVFVVGSLIYKKVKSKKLKDLQIENIEQNSEKLKSKEQNLSSENKKVQCSYCGSFFKEDLTKCPNCGSSKYKEEKK